MNKSTCLFSLLVFTLILASSLAVAANKIYRWVDADGIVHFGEQPPGQFNAEEVKVEKSPDYVPPPTQAPTAPAGAPGAAADPKAGEPEPSYAQQRRDARAKAREEAAREKRQKSANCDAHRQLIAKLEPMPRVIIQREDGTVERMDDNERLDQLKKSKDYVNENCRD